MSVTDDQRNLVDQRVKAFGRLDLAFNNAGIAQFGKSIVELKEDEWDRVLAINLRGVFLSLKYHMPAMLATGGGAIVNASSVGGLVGTAGLSAYQASKHGLIGLTKVAAMEGATQNIRVNAICPGATRSDMFDEWTADPEVNAECSQRIRSDAFLIRENKRRSRFFCSVMHPPTSQELLFQSMED